MATDRNGVTITVGNDLVPAGEVRKALSGNRSVALIGQVPHICDDADAIVAAAIIVANGAVAFTADQPMGGKRLTGLAVGTSSGHAVEVVSAVASFLLKAGDTMAGNLAMAGNDVIQRTRPTQFKDANYTVLVTDEMIMCNTNTIGAFTVTLPTEAAAARQAFTVFLDTAGNDLTVDVDGGGNINGSSSITMDTLHQSRTIWSNGFEYFIIATSL